MYDYVDSSFKNVFLVISCKKLEAENILNQISCIQRISVYKNRRTENSLNYFFFRKAFKF